MKWIRHVNGRREQGEGIPPVSAVPVHIVTATESYTLLPDGLLHDGQPVERGRAYPFAFADGVLTIDVGANGKASRRPPLPPQVPDNIPPQGGGAGASGRGV